MKKYKILSNKIYVSHFYMYSTLSWGNHVMGGKEVWDFIKTHKITGVRIKESGELELNEFLTTKEIKNIGFKKVKGLTFYQMLRKIKNSNRKFCNFINHPSGKHVVWNKNRLQWSNRGVYVVKNTSFSYPWYEIKEEK